MLVIHNLGRIPEYYRHFAGNKVRALYERAEGGSLTEWYRLANGCVLRIKVVGDHGYIRLKCGGCPTMYNGLFDPITDATHQDALYEDTVDGETVERFHRYYPEGGTEWENSAKFKVSGPQSLTKRPGLYSGLMRKVVQALLGTNQNVQYDYGWTKTHGIYEDAQGRHFVIEISSDGVYSWPIPACTASTSIEGLEYTPLYVSLEAGRPGSAVQLADSSEMSDAYAKTPIFSACGWAFSYSGNKASNVALSTSGGYYVSHLYTITITENENGPVNATISEVESDTLWGDKITHVKYPDYSLATLTSFDWLNGNPVEPSSDDTAPVHCWYDDDSLIVCRFVRIRSAAFSSSFDNIEFYEPFSSIPVPGGTAENVSGTQSTRSFTITGYVSAVASRTYTGSETIAVELGSWSGKAVHGFTSGRHYTDAVAAGWKARTNVDATETYTEALVIAYGDREAVFHARQYEKTGTADEELTQIGFIGSGSVYGTSADPEHAGGQDWEGLVAIGDITPPTGADPSERAFNQVNPVGDDIGGSSTSITVWSVYELSGYFYGRTGVPMEVGALEYATAANEDQFGADPCFTGTTRIDQVGDVGWDLQSYQSYASYSTTPPCFGPAEFTANQVYQVSKYWIGDPVEVHEDDYYYLEEGKDISESSKEAVLIRNSGSTTIDAGASDFGTTWCQFLETGDYQMLLVIPDCSDDEKTAYLNGIDSEYADFPEDMLGGGTYPVTELNHIHACFIGNP